MFQHLRFICFLVLLLNYLYEMNAHLNNFKIVRPMAPTDAGNENIWHPLIHHRGWNSYNGNRHPYTQQLKTTHQYTENPGRQVANRRKRTSSEMPSPSSAEQMTIIKPYMLTVSKRYQRNYKNHGHNSIWPQSDGNRKRFVHMMNYNTSDKNKHNNLWHVTNRSGLRGIHDKDSLVESHLRTNLNLANAVEVNQNGRKSVDNEIVLPDIKDYDENALCSENSNGDCNEDKEDDDDDVDYNENDGDGNVFDEESLNALLMPLENFLTKVRQYCDIASRAFNETTLIYENERKQKPLTPTLPLKTLSSTAIKTTNNQNQGRTDLKGSEFSPWPWLFTAKSSAPKATINNSASRSSTRNFSSEIGTARGKRLKRKLRKFLLPLLIAYKLKFIALIPLLIGGLTLLVGTTGLAGFFFALFTAVMSLKSTGGGSKSIIVKKI